MMRELKFRAWNKENNTMILWSAEFFSDMSPVTNYGSEIDFDSFELMQFTGLKDKNGVEIYEGDILDFYEGEWGGKFTPEVVEWSKIIGTWDMSGSLADLSEWRQVIGNIYERKHLIGEG